MRKQRFVYGLVVLFQTMILTGIGLAMFHLATTPREASSSPIPLIGKIGDTGAETSHVILNGVEGRFSTREGLLDELGIVVPQPDRAAGLLPVDPVEHPGGHLRQTASQIDDSPLKVCGFGAS